MLMNCEPLLCTLGAKIKFEKRYNYHCRSSFIPPCMRRRWSRYKSKVSNILISLCVANKDYPCNITVKNIVGFDVSMYELVWMSNCNGDVV